MAEYQHKKKPNIYTRSLLRFELTTPAFEELKIFRTSDQRLLRSAESPVMYYLDRVMKEISTAWACLILLA